MENDSYLRAISTYAKSIPAFINDWKVRKVITRAQAKKEIKESIKDIQRLLKLI